MLRQVTGSPYTSEFLRGDEAPKGDQLVTEVGSTPVVLASVWRKRNSPAAI